MPQTRHLPAADRLSVLAAAILLAYASTRFINLPIRELELQLPRLYLSFEFNSRTVVALLVAGMTATGADWLLRDHPMFRGRHTLEHWLLPALTAWTIGAPLYQLPFGLEWLVAFAIGGALLMLVLVAEYIIIDPQDDRHALATAGLTAVSFALFLLLAIALHSAGVRLFLVLPALSLATGFVVLRTLHLRLQGEWAIWQSLTVTLVVAHFTASLHYWPMAPVTYGLALLGPAYALTSLVGSLSEGMRLRQAILEPVLVLVTVWGTAIWTR